MCIHGLYGEIGRLNANESSGPDLRKRQSNLAFSIIAVAGLTGRAIGWANADGKRARFRDCGEYHRIAGDKSAQWR